MYETRILKVPRTLIKENKIGALVHSPLLEEAAAYLKQGELVAFPTETVYGLGADAASSEAVKKIFTAKGRPQDNPLIVHVADIGRVEQIVKGNIPEAARILMEEFWPGPLTLILDKSDFIPKATTAGLETVAVRMPSHPIALALIKASGTVIAAPSANSSGFPSPTTAAHVYKDLKGKIPLIIDGGRTEIGLESTVIDIREDPPLILRPGGLAREEISRVLNKEIYLQNEIQKMEPKTAPKSPGMKYRHYSPTTDLMVVKAEQLTNLCRQLSPQSRQKTVLILTEESKSRLEADWAEPPSFKKVVSMGSQCNLREIAASLFALLRRFDREDVDLIIVEEVAETGLGEAIMNRLNKAASTNPETFLEG